MNLSGSPKSWAPIYGYPNNNSFEEVASVCWSDPMNQCSTDPLGHDNCEVGIPKDNLEPIRLM